MRIPTTEEVAEAWEVYRVCMSEDGIVSLPDAKKEFHYWFLGLHVPAPDGWFPFGTHVDDPRTLQFWGEDETGMPIWERPVGEQAP